jgi:hypothetical protein
LTLVVLIGEIGSNSAKSVISEPMPGEGDQQCDIDHKVEGEDGADEKSEPATQ